MFNFAKYCFDRKIGADESRATLGWINVQCPFCWHEQTEHKSYLGFNLRENYLTCWRCGGHSVEDWVMALERVEYHKACRIVQEYDADFEYRPPPGPRRQAKGLQGTMEWPAGTLPLQDIHRRYLASRGYDPEFLEGKYGLMGTVNAGPYASRIMAPIYHRGQWVSYQGRTMVKGVEPKYKACRPDLELMHHRDTLYNLDNAGDIGIIVEGVFDVWRLGDGAVATYGTSVRRSRAQILLAASRFRRVFVIFDTEPEAQARARWLRDQLSALGVEATNVSLNKGDPGDLSQEEANKLKKELLK